MSLQNTLPTRFRPHQVSARALTINSDTLTPRALGRKTTTRPTVLIIDDDADLRFMLAFALNERGYEVVEAEDGQEGLETALRKSFDLILVDFDLPFVHGLDVVRQLRLHPRFEALPIIMMTSHGNRVYDSAVKAGCDQFLPKPIDFDRLYEMLDYFAPVRAAQAA